MLEIYREFRNSFFKNVDSFYELFFEQTDHMRFDKIKFDKFMNDYSLKYPFYTKNDLFDHLNSCENYKEYLSKKKEGKYECKFCGKNYSTNSHLHRQTQ